MDEETKNAFRNVVRSHDGDLIRDYFEMRLREYSDVRNATPENFQARAQAVTFIENEILARFKTFDERIQDLGDDVMI